MSALREKHVKAWVTDAIRSTTEYQLGLLDGRAAAAEETEQLRRALSWHEERHASAMRQAQEAESRRRRSCIRGWIGFAVVELCLVLLAWRVL